MVEYINQLRARGYTIEQSAAEGAVLRHLSFPTLYARFAGEVDQDWQSCQETMGEVSVAREEGSGIVGSTFGGNRSSKATCHAPALRGREMAVDGAMTTYRHTEDMCSGKTASDVFLCH